MSTGTLSNLVESDNSLSVLWKIEENAFKTNQHYLDSPRISEVSKRIEFQLCVFKIYFNFNSSYYYEARLVRRNNTDKTIGIRCTLNFIKSENNIGPELKGSGLFLSGYGNIALIETYRQDEFENQITNGTLKIQIILETLPSDFLQIIEKDLSKITGVKYEPKTCKKNYSTASPEIVLDTLLTSQKFSDLVIKVEGHEIAAHKCILALKSSVLCAMFENNFSKRNSGCLEMTDIDKDTMTSFVRYLYTNQVTITNVSFAQKLFIVADKYDVQDLKILCEKYILDNINASNVVDILIFSDLHNAGDIKDQATDYAVGNVKALGDTQLDVLEEKAPHLKVLLKKCRRKLFS